MWSTAPQLCAKLSSKPAIPSPGETRSQQNIFSPPRPTGSRRCAEFLWSRVHTPAETQLKHLTTLARTQASCYKEACSSSSLNSFTAPFVRMPQLQQSVPHSRSMPYQLETTMQDEATCESKIMSTAYVHDPSSCIWAKGHQDECTAGRIQRKCIRAQGRVRCLATFEVPSTCVEVLFAVLVIMHVDEEAGSPILEASSALKQLLPICLLGTEEEP